MYPKKKLHLFDLPKHIRAFNVAVGDQFDRGYITNRSLYFDRFIYIFYQES